MTVVLAFLACLIPSALLFVRLKSINKDKPGYADSCKKALLYGILSSVPIVLADLVLDLLAELLKLHTHGEILWAAFRAFILFALVEETCKFLLFKRVIRKSKCAYSWFDLTVFMTLVGTGFEILESLVYAFSMGPIQAIVRGITMLHAVFGFITGYFYGRALRTGSKRLAPIGFLIAFLFHGLYDFSLSPAVAAFSVFDFIAVDLELAGLAVLIVAIVFFAKRKRDEKYTAPLRADGTADEPVPDAPAEEPVPDASTDGLS